MSQADKTFSVEVNYRTHAGNVASWQGNVTATDSDVAIEAASERVHGFKRCAKIDGGDVQERVADTPRAPKRP